MSSATTVISSPTPSPTAGSGGGGGPNSPLLFFVALGFGVVFTNLWIIVGVKYCFRYNQRNRARLAGEDPDAVDLAAMPQRRRRREKKLMTIDEVNERFPLVKYKTWRTTRAEQGLSTAGGVANAPGRPPSVRNASRDSHDVVREKIEPATPTTTVPVVELTGKDPKSAVRQIVTEVPPDSALPSASTLDAPVPATLPVSVPAPVVLRRASDNGVEDELDQIQTAIPPEQLPELGDSCAICLDTIEDDDDIRGLTCGHTFHASCMDPWLTGRRACCPLCKADFYVPKPQAEGAQSDNRRSEVASTPFSIIPGGRTGYRRGRSRLVLPGVFFGPPHRSRSHSEQDANRRVRRSRLPPPSTVNPTTDTQAPEIIQPQESTSWRQRLRLPQLAALTGNRAGRGTETSAQPNDTPPTQLTPGQLESGLR